MRIKKGSPEELEILGRLTNEIRKDKVHHREDYYKTYGVTRSQMDTLIKRAKERIKWEKAAGKECSETREKLEEMKEDIKFLHERIEADNNTHDDEIRNLVKTLDNTVSQMAKLIINNQKLRDEISHNKRD